MIHENNVPPRGNRDKGERIVSDIQEFLASGWQSASVEWEGYFKNARSAQSAYYLQARLHSLPVRFLVRGEVLYIHHARS